MVQNLSQLKKKLVPGAEFQIVNHCRKENIGQRRRVTSANSQGFHSVIVDEPESKISLSNNGKGPWLGWEKASFWKFEVNGLCSVYSSNIKYTDENLVMSIVCL